MKIQKLALATATTVALLSVHGVTSSAKAAVLGGSSTCSEVSFSYLDCAGSFLGNDKGAQGSGLSNLNSLFGEGWYFAGDNEDELVSLTNGGEGTQLGSASTKLSGFGAIAIKAGNSYSLYTVKDLATFDWGTAGVAKVGKKGNIPGLSHLSVYKQTIPEPPVSQKVPEPSMLLGIAGIVGVSKRLRRKNG
ncbi:PEP-CTERM sorting domain-containing protein [Leptolyngbya sp. BC1307]|uniref:PEP-CTERM sorting domain-containing protein n=1 Tax=Leptolyngbya sp. BC1307 TaxID=2029589 RepID=UPI000EFB509E|nr:PEP-CTERM sorting domain-containing protein [Leptolyngbya sp. BC1307]